MIVVVVVMHGCCRVHSAYCARQVFGGVPLLQ
jgi:hypothetical protein